jgi:maltose alpha-D-glucosyltransferase/alpha-amylase
VLADPANSQAPPIPAGTLVEQARAAPSMQVLDWVGPVLDRVRLLGVRTAELHLALAGDPSDPITDPLFRPEPYDIMHQQSIYGTAVSHAARAFDVLRRRSHELAPDVRARADEVVARELELDRILARVTKRRIDVVRTRTHGDYHLGQVLWTGADFVIIDFEGEPGRPLSQRRFKRCPLRDVAGMIRSFQYASIAALQSGKRRPEDLALLEGWARDWAAWTSAQFLAGYLERARGTGVRFVPKSDADLELLLEFLLLEKCIYEIGYEINNRPEWVDIPLRGLLALMGPAA